MKKIPYLYLFIALAITACETPAGGCSHPIRASLTEYNFGAEGGSVIITVEDSFWWIGGVNSDPFSEKFEITRDSSWRILKIEADWFTISKESQHTLIVEVLPNVSETERWIHFGLEAGNCYLGIRITQSAE